MLELEIKATELDDKETILRDLKSLLNETVDCADLMDLRLGENIIGEPLVDVTFADKHYATIPINAGTGLDLIAEIVNYLRDMRRRRP